MIISAIRAVRRPFMAVVFLLLLAVTVTAPTSHAAPRASMDPAGSISGVVANGTHSGAPVAGQQVTLRAMVLSRAPKDAGSVTTDAQGRFAFGGLDTSGETTYEIYTRYQGGFFVTAPVSFGGSAAAAQTANLTIYDTTTDMSALRVSNLTVLVSAVNKAKGLIPVGAFYTFDNTGSRAIAGSLTPPAGGGMPQGMLRFALPASATNLTLGAGFGDAQTAQIATGFAATATIPPGLASFAFAFDLPYTRTAATLPLSALYPTARVTVLAPPAYRVTAPGFVADAPISANGQQFQQLHADNVGARVSQQVALAALPEAGVDPDVTFGQVLAIGAVLALLLALLLALFAGRGDLGALRQLARRPARRQSARAAVQARNATRQRLLEALLDLDERHAAGAIGDGAYDRRRAELRTELRALLAAEGLTSQRREGTSTAEDAENHRGRREGKKSTTEASEETEEGAEIGKAEDRGRHIAEEDTIDPVEAHGVRPAAAAAARHPSAGSKVRSVRARRSRATAGGGR